MSDTIAAIATAPGQGGIAIVRVSGDMAEDILRRIFRPVGGKHPLPTHLLTYGYIVEDTERIDECMAVIMRAPKSYTREDVVEFQLHGGGCVAQKVLALCLSSGARLAQPGEFTRRAFLNGRIDLSQAEAVMDLIAAQGEQSRKAAMRQLTGGASSFIRKAADELYAIQAGGASCRAVRAAERGQIEPAQRAFRRGKGNCDRDSRHDARFGGGHADALRQRHPPDGHRRPARHGRPGGAHWR